MRRYSCAPQGISLRKMMCQCCGTFFLWQFVCSYHKVYHFCFTTHKLRCKLRVCLDWGNFKVKIQELENRGKEVQTSVIIISCIPNTFLSILRAFFLSSVLPSQLYSFPAFFSLPFLYFAFICSKQVLKGKRKDLFHSPHQFTLSAQLPG